MLLIRVLWLYSTLTIIGNTYACHRPYRCCSCLYSTCCTQRRICPYFCFWNCCRPNHICRVIKPHHTITKTRTSTIHKSSAISTSLSTTETKGTNTRSKISTTSPSVSSTSLTGVKFNYQSMTTPEMIKHHKLSQTTNSFHSFTRKSTDRTSKALVETTKQNVDTTFKAKDATTSVHTISSDPPKYTAKVSTTSAKRVDNGAEICQCDISYLEKVEFWKSKNFTPKEMLDYMAPLMKTVLKELQLNKTRLLTNKLKRTSAPDNRRSSKQIGVAAITFIVGVVVLVIFIDVISVLRFFNILEN